MTNAEPWVKVGERVIEYDQRIQGSKRYGKIRTITKVRSKGTFILDHDNSKVYRSYANELGVTIGLTRFMIKHLTPELLADIKAEKIQIKVRDAIKKFNWKDRDAVAQLAKVLKL